MCKYFSNTNILESNLSLVSQELTFGLRDFQIEDRDWREYVPWGDPDTINVYALCPQIKKGAVKR